MHAIVDDELRRQSLAKAWRNGFADLAGVTRKSINAIETGNMVPSTILALKLARALGVRVEGLFSLEVAAD